MQLLETLYIVIWYIVYLFWGVAYLHEAIWQYYNPGLRVRDNSDAENDPQRKHGDDIALKDDDISTDKIKTFDISERPKNNGKNINKTIQKPEEFEEVILTSNYTLPDNIFFSQDSSLTTFPLGVDNTLPQEQMDLYNPYFFLEDYFSNNTAELDETDNVAKKQDKENLLETEVHQETEEVAEKLVDGMERKCDTANEYSDVSCMSMPHPHSSVYEDYNTVDKLELESFDKEELVAGSEILINNINNLIQDQFEKENDSDDNDNATKNGSCCFGWLCKTSKKQDKTNHDHRCPEDNKDDCNCDYSCSECLYDCFIRV